MARIIRDADIARLLALPPRLDNDYTVSPHAMRALLLYNLSVLDEQIDSLYDQLGADEFLPSTSLGWPEEVPDQVRDSWSSLNYLLAARESLAAVLRSVDGRFI